MTNRLKVARAEKRVNQTITARAVGIGRDRYLRIELEYTEPTSAEIARLAKYFRKPATELFPGYAEGEAVAS